MAWRGADVARILARRPAARKGFLLPSPALLREAHLRVEPRVGEVREQVRELAARVGDEEAGHDRPERFVAPPQRLGHREDRRAHVQPPEVGARVAEHKQEHDAQVGARDFILLLSLVPFRKQQCKL